MVAQLRQYDWQYWLPSVCIGLAVVFMVSGAVMAFLRWRGKTEAARAVRSFTGGLALPVLLCAAVLAVGNYTKFGNWRYSSYLNAYEFYHYYMGSKYAAEIGYTDLYNASLVADVDTGRKYSNPKKSIRNLDTGRYRSVEGVLAEADTYRDLFSEERWEEWLKDIRWFKSKLHTGRWNGILRDKGYNATPAWSMLVGGLLSNNVDTDDETGMFLLSLLDPLLMGLAFLCVLWAFGPRTALLLVVLIGTSYMMRFSHMKGAYLRTDFTMSLVMSVSFLKKGWYKTGGVLAGYSFISRVFPAVFLFGLGVKFLWDLAPVAWDALKRVLAWGRGTARLWKAAAAVLAVHLAWLVALKVGPPVMDHGAPTAWGLFFGPSLPVLDVAVAGLAVTLWGIRTGRLDSRYFQFFLAWGLTGLALALASLVYWGPDLWKEFLEKITYHNQDISPWRVGFKYIYMARWKDNFAFTLPFHEWQPYIRSAMYKLNPGFWRTIMAVVLVFCLFAARGLKDHRALAFGFVPCFFLVAPTYYYYIMLAVPALFLLPKVERPIEGLGVAALFAQAMAGYWFYSMWTQKYATYYYLSWMVGLIVVLMMVAAIYRGRTLLHGTLAVAATVLAAWPLLWFYLYRMYPDYNASSEEAWKLYPVAPAYFAVMLLLELFWMWRRGAWKLPEEPEEAAPAGKAPETTADEAATADTVPPEPAPEPGMPT